MPLVQKITDAARRDQLVQQAGNKPRAAEHDEQSQRAQNYSHPIHVST